MRTRKGIKLTLIGILICNFKLKGEQNNILAENTAEEIIKFLYDEEKNLVLPPIESPSKWFKKLKLWFKS